MRALLVPWQGKAGTSALLKIHWYAPRNTEQPRTIAPLATVRPTGIQGYVADGFGAVRDAFLENFSRRKELGGACCIYRHGEKVVDLWGGTRNKAPGDPWEEDTMVLVHSTTKGLAAMTLAVAHSHGWLDYEERVCSYWPEFSQQGKDKITVRQLLAHQAGLHAIDEPVDCGVVADLLSGVMARQKHCVDPRHRSLGQFFQDEIASPWGSTSTSVCRSRSRTRSGVNSWLDVWMRCPWPPSPEKTSRADGKHR